MVIMSSRERPYAQGSRHCGVVLVQVRDQVDRLLTLRVRRVARSPMQPVPRHAGPADALYTYLNTPAVRVNLAANSSRIDAVERSNFVHPKLLCFPNECSHCLFVIPFEQIRKVAILCHL